MILTGLLIGAWLVGSAICIPLFYDHDDPWGIAWGLAWPLLLLAAIAGAFFGACVNFYTFIFDDASTFNSEDDPRG